VRDGSAPEIFTIGYLARLAPEKGLHFLCQAYRILRSRIPAARLSAAGYLPPEHKSFFAGIVRELESAGLSAGFHYHGVIDRRQKVDFLHGLSVLSVPEYYRDPKGLFLLEAMAAGIPVVQPRQGAFTEIIETTGGGILFEPGEPERLAEALCELWKDPERMAELGRRGAEGVRAHYSATRMAEKTAEIFESLRPQEGREVPQ
jgi:glycosyltransferase involved in cell wall biosynthesis